MAEKMCILLATDGSSSALKAARALAALPLSSDSRLILTTVLPVGAEEEGAEILTATQQALADLSLSILTEVRFGVPAEEILRAEEVHRPDLMVLGSRGRSPVTRFWLGSVAERVAQYSQCSVLLVWPKHTAFRRLLITLDRTPASNKVAEWFQRFPMPADCEVHLVTFVTLHDVFTRWRETWLPPFRHILRLLERKEQREAERYLQALSVESFGPGSPPRLHVRSGDLVSGVEQMARKLSIDLLVVGAFHRSLFAPVFFEDVADQVLEQMPCSLLVVKPPRE